MRDKKITFDTPLLLRGGFDVLETDEYFTDIFMNGYKAIADLTEVGGSVVTLKTETKKASEWFPHRIPPEVTPDTLAYSVHWSFAVTVRQALLLAPRVVRVRGVADGANRLEDAAESGLGGAPLHPRAMGRVVHLGAHHSGQGAQPVLVQPETGRATDVL